MKRSKIFLGVTSGLLAVAAFAASKSRVPSTIQASVLTRVGLNCVHTQISNNLKIVTQSNRHITGTARTASGYTLYQTVSAGVAPCQVKLYTATAE